MTMTQRAFRTWAARIVAASMILSLSFACSCSKKGAENALVLPEDIYGFYLGQTKEAVFKRAKNIATITRAPEPPLGYRGELYDFSAPLERYPEIQRVRCAFLDNRLMEVIVYFRDTSRPKLDWLKMQLEGRYNTEAIAEDGKYEMAQKTYRLAAPRMSITLRRITKKEVTELYIQYLHDELHRRLVERKQGAGSK